MTALRLPPILNPQRRPPLSTLGKASRQTHPRTARPARGPTWLGIGTMVARAADEHRYAVETLGQAGIDARQDHPLSQWGGTLPHEDAETLEVADPLAVRQSRCHAAPTDRG